ncbi:unnamed protein product [Aureobasidium vineae]|uniref:Nascent polypeptide-associated complex subunit alpha-like UBA domain-containing protein n=1 Tax=Aureobasidium vineae TaxID=2773715 RepID=A0A9N8JGX7_9PEZI|nr:unnamed protein product [Aureobasidium vineae]
MAEPQPTQIQEGDQAPSAIPGSNRSETAALNSLDNQSADSKSTNTASTAALGKAMKDLDIASEEKSEAKNVKVEMADVVLLAENLDVSRARATELLKANEADPIKAMRAWVAA